jgi:quinate dehydrogenase (quinone)
MDSRSSFSVLLCRVNVFKFKDRLPVGSQSGPMTYVSPKTGKQYIIINAGGARQSPDRGDYIIAYALPDKP